LCKYIVLDNSKQVFQVFLSKNEGFFVRNYDFLYTYGQIIRIFCP